MQSTTEEENRLSELITSETRRSTLGTVLQTVVNYGRPSSAPSSRGKEQRASISEKRSPIASPAATPLNFGRGLCCMFIQFSKFGVLSWFLYAVLFVTQFELDSRII